MGPVSIEKPLSLQIDDLEIAIAPDDRPPFNVSAVVEEQDVALLLGTHTSVACESDKPAWYLSEKMAAQSLYTPGQVLFRDASPRRLLAMVHDFDQDPSWNDEWVAHALCNIVHLVDQKGITSLKLPVLGARYGRIALDEFLSLFVLAFLRQRSGCLGRLWLCVDEARCAHTLHWLEDHI